jgi:MFS family permease
MHFRGRLAGSYTGAVALVILALTPHLVLTGSLLPMQMLLQQGTGLSSAGLQLSEGMANAAYCLGTVVAVQLTTRLNGHRLLIGFAGVFTLGSVLAAWAPVPGLFVAGRVLQGLMTGLMLIAAVPPLVTGWPKEKMPKTPL